MRRVLVAIAVLLAALALVVTTNTLRFASRQIAVAAVAPLALDVAGGGEPRRGDPLSHGVAPGTGAGRPRGVPRLPSLSRGDVPGRAQVARAGDGRRREPALHVEGTGGGRRAALLLAHQDVVPVDPGTEAQWSHPPFAGAIADGYVWGRGAVDDKSSVIAVLEAVETLVADGYQPRRTVYLAFGHDEEVGGSEGAARIAEALAARGVTHYAFVGDEGSR
jgi:carboxypeptidase PM20D1